MKSSPSVGPLALGAPGLGGNWPQLLPRKAPRATFREYGIAVLSVTERHGEARKIVDTPRPYEPVTKNCHFNPGPQMSAFVR